MSAHLFLPLSSSSFWFHVLLLRLCLCGLVRPPFQGTKTGWSPSRCRGYERLRVLISYFSSTLLPHCLCGLLHPPFPGIKAAEAPRSTQTTSVLLLGLFLFFPFSPCADLLCTVFFLPAASVSLFLIFITLLACQGPRLAAALGFRLWQKFHFFPSGFTVDIKALTPIFGLFFFCFAAHLLVRLPVFFFLVSTTTQLVQHIAQIAMRPSSS